MALRVVRGYHVECSRFHVQHSDSHSCKAHSESSIQSIESFLLHDVQLQPTYQMGGEFVE